MALSATQLARDIRAGKFAPLYYFYGDDDYRVREATNFLAQNYLTDSAGFSGLSRLDLADQKFDDIRIELAEPPFFGERKLVVVVDPQRLSPKQQDELIRSLQPPLPDRVVVFVTRAARKPKKTAAFFKKMEIHAAVTHFGWLTEREAISRAAGELKRREVTADAEALRELFELTAGDSGRLVNECEKLASFVGAGGVVSPEHVRDICAENPRRTVFELVDIVAAGDLSEARCALEKLLTAGESPTGLLFWLGSHYLNLYLLREGRELAPQMRWLANRLRGQAKSFSSEQLRAAIAEIADCEAFMKGGISRRRAESPREALEDLVRDLCLQRTPTHQTTTR